MPWMRCKELRINWLSYRQHFVNSKGIYSALFRKYSVKHVIAIDTRSSSQLPSNFEVMVKGGTEPTGIDAVGWAKKVEELGAGAILPTSMDTDGTQAGYDIAMTRAIADAVDLPVIASGGAGTLEHLYEAITQGKADAVLVASIVHFGKYTIAQIKEYLTRRGIPVRH